MEIVKTVVCTVVRHYFKIVDCIVRISNGDLQKLVFHIKNENRVTLNHLDSSAVFVYLDNCYSGAKPFDGPAWEQETGLSYYDMYNISS